MLPVIIITGPTACGKTELAMKLADHFECQLISADSSLVYRRMNVGTAKPPARVLQQYPHALVDIRDIDQFFSAGDFVAEAGSAIRAARDSNKLPVLVGGTLLYLRSLLYGLSELPAADPQLRAQIEQEAQLLGWRAMHQQLVVIDPVAGAAIHPNDRQRIQRALEVYRLTGRPISELQSEAAAGILPGQKLTLILGPPSRSWLHRRIRERSDQMICNGLVEEVAGLVGSKSLDLPEMFERLPALRAVGYRQTIEALAAGEVRAEPLAEKISIATRQLAKRQLTWLHGNPAGVWLTAGASANCTRAIELVSRVIDGG